MPRIARTVASIPEEDLEAAAADFARCALKALQGRVLNQRELADRLGWPATTVSSALKGRFTFRSWPKICKALGLDPIDELVRGRREILREEEERRAVEYRLLLRRAEADAMVALWRKLPAAERARVLDLMKKDVSPGRSPDEPDGSSGC